MKKLKNYAMALVALVIAATSMTLMSFNKTNSSNDDLVWFNVENGSIQQDEETNGPTSTCTLEPDAKTCMVAFYPEQLDENGHAPTSNPADPSVQERAYSPIEP